MVKNRGIWIGVIVVIIIIILIVAFSPGAKAAGGGGMGGAAGTGGAGGATDGGSTAGTVLDILEGEYSTGDCRNRCRLLCKNRRTAIFGCKVGTKCECKRACKSDCAAGHDIQSIYGNYVEE